jgi:hypothetical protein
VKEYALHSAYHMSRMTFVLHEFNKRSLSNFIVRSRRLNDSSFTLIRQQHRVTWERIRSFPIESNERAMASVPQSLFGALLFSINA